ncbi:hypothetical protein D8674_037769 [Pyrus ussuriensis x Pyrus communis]|uniref:Uncharacterized protein n=1 Tax=Pyrus ussuriensis x Pyrus communis TaxID=2448454 RepID=A0A5N5GYB9_9ROSA|nr:hypothetical protein D8674_003886 [Pyrus ussuriensis x Pyrus communis]KAB2604349.1 hypothetical protein D8674_037776 [Pyrus ussuriensis x Pyrus communis]KAB2620615.1 hypothetical protein D8674_037769 [Pyrus ussuriensis x Pyrus communis]
MQRNVGKACAIACVCVGNGMIATALGCLFDDDACDGWKQRGKHGTRVLE